MKATLCCFTGFKALNGSNLRTYFVAKEFVKRGYDLNCITPNANDAKTCVDRFGVTDSKHVGLDINRFKKSRLKLYPLFAMKASRMIKDCDFVFGQSLPSALAIKLSNTKGKKMIDYCDLWSEYWLYANPTAKGRLVYTAVKNAEGFSTKGIDVLFTITKKLKEMMVERGSDESKINIIRDGVDLKMFNKKKVSNEFYDKYNLEKNNDYVVYQGGIGVHDGVQFLLNSAPTVLKDNPNAKFLIVGTGAHLKELKKQAVRLGLGKNVIFTGWVDYEDMPQFMNLAKINAVPLPDSPATQGVVTYKLMEAMACGTPTIIGDLPGVREAVKNKQTAYLVRSEDRLKLAEGINQLLNNKTLYSKISKDGLKLIKNHDWRDIAKDMVDVMEQNI